MKRRRLLYKVSNVCETGKLGVVEYPLTISIDVCKLYQLFKYHTILTIYFLITLTYF